MNLVGVGPLFLYTERLEELATFYRDMLALPVKSYEPGHSVWLQTEPVQIVLYAPEAEWYPAPYEPQLGGTVIWLASRTTST